MTENEKAATFIGWREGDACSGDYGDDPNCPRRSTYHRAHLVPAPDMSYPKHTWSLLRALLKKGVPFTFTPFDADDMTSIVTRKAVALYDAEHSRTDQETHSSRG